MSFAMRKCKICGTEYEYCHTFKRVADVFRWQDVACCPEHGMQYLHDIRVSRGEIDPIENKDAELDILSEDFEDDELEDDFDEDLEDDDDEE